MGGFSVSTLGFRELEQKLEKLATTDAANVVRDGLRAGGEVIQAAVRERAPVRPTLPSGTALPEGALKRDIELHIGQEDGLLAAIIRPGTETGYAADWVEYGHRLIKRGTAGILRSGKRRRKAPKEIGDVPAHPFIRPGFEVSAQAAVAEARVNILSGIEQVAGK